MKALTFLFFLAIPFLGTSQSLNLTLSPKGNCTANWQQKSVQVIKQRLLLFGLAPADYQVRAEGQTLKVKLKSDGDPVTLQHFCESKGNFRLLPIYKFDDPSMKSLFQAFSTGKLRNGASIQKVTDYFKINDYALEGHSYRRFPPAVIGMAAAEHIQLIDDFLQTARIKELLPQGAKFYWARKGSRLHPGMYDLYLADTRAENGLYLPSIENLQIETKANHYGRVRPVLKLQLKGETKARLRAISLKNIERELIALVDDKVLTAPIVEGPIETGELELEGSFKGKETILIRRMLMDLKLPCQLVASTSVDVPTR